MSNVIPFPRPAVDGAERSRRGHAGAAFLSQPGERSHAVQLYEGEEFLVESVSRFLAAGLEAGDDGLVVATPEHREGFLQCLGAPGREAVRSGQLVLTDAREMLSFFMIGDMPDADLFRSTLAALIARTRDGGAERRRLRAFGEMVDLLWREGNSLAAIRLEELWNEASKAHAFSLLCAYAMGNFCREGDAAKFVEVCSKHSHVLPTEKFVAIDDAAARLREISLLQQRACALEGEIEHGKKLESALRDALREQAHADAALRAAMRREREERARAEASDAFKEVFLGILGHDLRNPLNSVLMTTRLMVLRGDLSPENATRMRRVVSSGVRMERMIDQVLDLTRARLADGIRVVRAEHDFSSLVLGVVDELRAAHPSLEIVVDVEGPCVAWIDADRFEQVVSNLLGNAVVHGDAKRAIRVTLRQRDGTTSLDVHNYGRSIHDDTIPLLFDPFRRGAEPCGRPDGLGLGLYITDQVVRAHGGRVAVASSEGAGTHFEVLFPTHA